MPFYNVTGAMRALGSPLKGGVDVLADYVGSGVCLLPPTLLRSSFAAIPADAPADRDAEATPLSSALSLRLYASTPLAAERVDCSTSVLACDHRSLTHRGIAHTLPCLWTLGDMLLTQQHGAIAEALPASAEMLNLVCMDVASLARSDSSAAVTTLEVGVDTSSVLPTVISYIPLPHICAYTRANIATLLRAGKHVDAASDACRVMEVLMPIVKRGGVASCALHAAMAGWMHCYASTAYAMGHATDALALWTRTREHVHARASAHTAGCRGETPAAPVVQSAEAAVPIGPTHARAHAILRELAALPHAHTCTDASACLHALGHVHGQCSASIIRVFETAATPALREAVPRITLSVSGGTHVFMCGCTRTAPVSVLHACAGASTAACTDALTHCISATNEAEAAGDVETALAARLKALRAAIAHVCEVATRRSTERASSRSDAASQLPSFSHVFPRTRRVFVTDDAHDVLCTCVHALADMLPHAQAIALYDALVRSAVYVFARPDVTAAWQARVDVSGDSVAAARTKRTLAALAAVVGTAPTTAA